MDQQSRQQALRAYCPNVYLLWLGPCWPKRLGDDGWPLGQITLCTWLTWHRPLHITPRHACMPAFRQPASAASWGWVRCKTTGRGGNFFSLALVRGKKSDLIDVGADAEVVVLGFILLWIAIIWREENYLNSSAQPTQHYSTEARKLKEKSKAVWSRKLPHTALWNDANELAASTWLLRCTPNLLSS